MAFGRLWLCPARRVLPIDPSAGEPEALIHPQAEAEVLASWREVIGVGRGCQSEPSLT